jgi:hypothetical protein
MTDPTVPAETKSAPAKPGYKTTEFYLACAATLISILYASGLLSPDGASAASKATALIAAALTQLGYSISRGMAKSGGK